MAKQSLRIIHISDTHTRHNIIQVEECDIVIFSGDIGTRTNYAQLSSFLEWFEKLPAKKKIMIGGNHDIILDEQYCKTKHPLTNGYIGSHSDYLDALKLINKSDVVYLNHEAFDYEGVKIFGSPYTPSFHKEHWCFNKDRGSEIRSEWDKIPENTDILITHGPPLNYLDSIPTYMRNDFHINGHVGCDDLRDIVENKLPSLKLHCFGHIHDNTSIIMKSFNEDKVVLFSNGCCVDNRYNLVQEKPKIINLII